MRFLAPLLFLGFCLYLVLTPPTCAAADTYYAYVTEDGTYTFTDDLRSVPESEKAKVEERSWADLEHKVRKRMTTTAAGAVQSSDAIHVPSAAPPFRRPLSESCEGTVLITSERVQQGDYNRRMYVASNDCGDTLSITTEKPRVILTR